MWLRMTEERVVDSRQGIDGLCVATKTNAWKTVIPPKRGLTENN